MTQFDIMLAHATGIITKDTANRLLKDMHSNIQLNSTNTIGKEELFNNTVSDNPTKVTGWGHMAHGVGQPEKMYVENGVFDNNEDTGFTPGHMASFIICGFDGDKAFKIDHDHLVVKE